MRTTPHIENKAIAAGQSLEIAVIPLRNIEAEEWCLLNATFRLISEYGAIGGKTIFKPSDEPKLSKTKANPLVGLQEVSRRVRRYLVSSLLTKVGHLAL
jgi:CRISPR-associated protein Cmr1